MSAASTLEQVKQHLVKLKMAAALEVLDSILDQVQRTAGKDNCVRFDGLVLQIPADRHRYHYIKARVTFSSYGRDIERVPRPSAFGQVRRERTGHSR